MATSFLVEARPPLRMAPFLARGAAFFGPFALLPLTFFLAFFTFLILFGIVIVGRRLNRPIPDPVGGRRLARGKTKFELLITRSAVH